MEEIKSMEIKRKKPIILALFCFILAVFILVFWHMHRQQAKGKIPSIHIADNMFLSLTESSLAAVSQSENNEKSSGFIYQDPVAGFILEIPFGFWSETHQEGDGWVVVFEEKNGTRAFQVFFNFFDEEGPVTPDRIHRDIPELKIENPQIINIGNKNIPTLFFVGERGGQETKEAWLVGRGVIFQVMASLSFDRELAMIMATWKFIE